MIQNSSLKSARPINFKHNATTAQLYNFVNPSYSQAISINAPTLPPKTAPSFYPQTSLFDRYNRPNLFLRDCERRDLIPLMKNIVIHEQSLSQSLAQEIAFKSQKQKMKETKSPERSEAFTATQKIFKKSGQEYASKEYLQNQIMFNYKEMEENKKNQKKEYLTKVEKKIREAQHVISELALLQDHEKQEIGQINKFHETQKINAVKKAETRKNQQDTKTKTRFDEAKQFMRQLEEGEDIASIYGK